MSNLKLAQDFCDAWAARDLDGVLSRMAPDAIYHNIPMEVLKGHEQIRGFIEPAITHSSRILFEIHNMAEAPNGAVLTERTDYIDMGPNKIVIRVMGVFEFKNGLMTAWRDYFDLAEFTGQMPQP